MIAAGELVVTIRAATWAVSVRREGVAGDVWDSEGIGLMLAEAVARACVPRASHLAAALVQACVPADEGPSPADGLDAAEVALAEAAEAVLVAWGRWDARLEAAAAATDATATNRPNET